ncbi:beta-ketoacyl-[acyl-carrier-protein] synthase family protein [Streptomyces hesseae]|uniref:Beta-ketoacyl-[acyl-carrier-protein] synthase family protein n=1 Tax=Streptomyces hesseae TaxID=3075519 RepID=A0ABU2SFT6_9ACTN|nr:beta-ketoacyl-[acyl-carrier-protein] synthase family protein [Streptomyces sp. DSM 40473]MDT0447833.1 beta-ketoacyl-[acyl-carrier-protein] synthase family protein [Streptomyces sp. DSM 40473]
MSEAPVVTGLGLVTPGGVGLTATWRTVCRGGSTARNDPELAAAPVPLACRVPAFDRTRVPARMPWRLDRSTRLLLVAADESLRHAGIRPGEWEPSRVAVVIGSAAGGVTTFESAHRTFLEHGPAGLSPLTLPGFLPNMAAAAHLALELGVTGPSLHTSTACASGATALITACLLLAAGACDIALAGGTDAMVTPLCAAAFARMGALSRRTGEPAAASRPFDRDRDGFVLGEGAAVLVLERAAHARARGTPPLAHVVGHAATGDAHHPVAPDPRGRGLRAAVSQALRQAGVTVTDVHHVNAHGTGTPLNDRVEASVIRELYGRSAPSVTSVKGTLGHTMGAAGAIEAALTVQTLLTGSVPPTANFRAPDAGTAGIDLVVARPRQQGPKLAVSHSLGFGGHNTVVALAAA